MFLKYKWRNKTHHKNDIKSSNLHKFNCYIRREEEEKTNSDNSVFSFLCQLQQFVSVVSPCVDQNVGLKFCGMVD